MTKGKQKIGESTGLPQYEKEPVNNQEKSSNVFFELC